MHGRDSSKTKEYQLVRIAGLILAAGESRRMGRPKPLLAAGGTPFLVRVRAALRAGGLDPALVVLGARAEEIAAACDLNSDEVVLNPNYASGMFSSLVAGIRSLEQTSAEALVLALVDNPDCSPAVVRRLVEAFAATRAPIVEPVYLGKHGHPVLFSRSIWPELLVADPAQGAKSVVREHRNRGVQVEVDDPGVLIDLDTPEEYLRWSEQRLTS